VQRLVLSRVNSLRPRQYTTRADTLEPQTPRQSTPATSNETTATSKPTERQKHNARATKHRRQTSPIEASRNTRRNRNGQQTHPRQSTAAPGNKATAASEPDRNAAPNATKLQRPRSQTATKKSVGARDRTTKLTRRRKPERGTSAGCRRSGAAPC
jgi:hypothetical protein